MLWHLLIKSNFTLSTSKPFVIAMRLLLNIVAYWPGQTHDSRIFENIKITERLRDGVLVGDSGYACRAYLMTPILKPKSAGKCATILYISVLGALDC